MRSERALTKIQARVDEGDFRPQLTIRFAEWGERWLRALDQRETRDLDFFGLSPDAVERLCRLAAEKDRGFSPAILADMLGRFGRLRRPEFDIDDDAYQQLGHEVERWRERALNLAEGLSRERSPRREPGANRGLDL